jgi:hypothetical protein
MPKKLRPAVDLMAFKCRTLKVKICWFIVYTGMKLSRCHGEGVRNQIGGEQRAVENRFMSCIFHPIFLVSCLRQRDRGDIWQPKEFRNIYKISWEN